ncbi:MAG: hypothetical protein M1833_001645 [Piccolia ochrophora]|nr:MAG: hypothetical protein M1833_001645 [Piccolia ochrophora]
MPLFPSATEVADTGSARRHNPSLDKDDQHRRAQRIRVKNRRKMYLDRHPDYFSSALELADPLLYDRCIRRFQSTAEREEEGRKKGYSGVLEADLLRSEAKVAALAVPGSVTVTYERGPRGEIYPEDPDDAPRNKEEGQERWRVEMTERFLRGNDDDFDYEGVDENEDLDDRAQEERDEEEKWFEEEEPRWVLGHGHSGRRSDGEGQLRGQTGVQDF